MLHLAIQIIYSNKISQEINNCALLTCVMNNKKLPKSPENVHTVSVPLYLSTSMNLMGIFRYCADRNPATFPLTDLKLYGQ